MHSLSLLIFALAGLAVSAQTTPGIDAPSRQDQSYLGFDRNDYPGDGELKVLRQTFSYAGYWLNNPPGASKNSWKGKRLPVESAGFGFLVLFNGRLYSEIKANGEAAKLGATDGASAISSARAEGFPSHTIIFLDQEQGGRLLPQQREYLLAWVDAVNASGFEAGVYCSGIAAKEGSGKSIITAEDIRQSAGSRTIKFWVVNDACPPSPGCSVTRHLRPQASGVAFAEVWQFAQSPRRGDFAAGCRDSYGKDNNCYAGVPPTANRKQSTRQQVDLDVADSSDPSNGRRRGQP